MQGEREDEEETPGGGGGGGGGGCVRVGEEVVGDIGGGVREVGEKELAVVVMEEEVEKVVEVGV